MMRRQKRATLSSSPPEPRLLRRCRCSTGQRPIGPRLKLTLSPVGLHVDSFSVLYSPVGAHINGPGICTWYSEVNQEMADYYHISRLLLGVSPLVDDSDHLR